MPQPSRDILEMEAIIRNYTIYFIFLDIVFFVVFFLCVILLIRFFKSRKKLKDSDEYLRYTIQGQEEERARIARELHDTVAQNLRYCKSLCEKETKSENIAKVYDVLSKSLIEVRAMSYNLSPPDITRNDFLFCIKNLCGEFLDSSKIQIRLSILEDTDASFLTMEEIQNLYRIVQESLTNIVKHANAEEAVIMIRNEKGNEEKLALLASKTETNSEIKTAKAGGKLADEKPVAPVKRKSDGIVGKQSDASLNAQSVKTLNGLPDIIILDLFLGKESGLELLKTIRSKYPSVKVLVYTMYTKPGILALALEEGAHGFVEKSAPESVLIEAIKTIMAGDTFIQQNLISPLFIYRNMIDGFTKQEKIILKKILEQKTKRQISDELNIVPRTVDNYLSRIFEKTACHGIEEIHEKFAK